MAHLCYASAESVDEPGLGGVKHFTDTYDTVKITHYVEYHRFPETLGELTLTHESLLLQFVDGTSERIESAFTHCKDLRQSQQFLYAAKRLFILSCYIPRVESSTEKMSFCVFRQRAATYADPGRTGLLGQDMSMYVLDFQKLVFT